MKHTHLKHLFTALLLLCTTMVTAHDFEADGIYYNITGANTVEVTYRGDSADDYYDEYTGSVVIPESIVYNGTNYSVTRIGNNAFMYCWSMTSIEIPNSVKLIGDAAFYDCLGLTGIVIPNSVTRFGESAFKRCAGLRSIEIPNSVTEISVAAFTDCTSLTSVVIPNSVAYILDEAFAYCSSLASLTSLIPAESLNPIASSVFCEAGNGNCTLYVPYGAKAAYASTQGWSEFRNIVELAPEIIGGSCGTNVNWTFADGILTITGNGTMSDSYSWPWDEYKSEIKTVIIEDGVTTIGNAAFMHCWNLTNVEIPNSVKSIGESAFYGCIGLTSIDLPSSVKRIGSAAFFSCYGLKSIEIPNSVTEISALAFCFCTSLTSLTIPNSIAYIFDEAFAYCTGLTGDLVIPNSVAYIGCRAFGDCTGLTGLTIPNSITYICSEAFYNCTGLASITSLIPAENLNEIDPSVFYNVNCTLYVPYGAKAAYASAQGWSEFRNIVELAPEVTEVTVTVNQYGNATYCSPFALDFSKVEGLKAYAATGYNKVTQVVTLTRLQTAQEGTGLFLVAEPGEYIVPVIEYSNDYTLNLLVGTLEQTTVNSTVGTMSNYKFTITDGGEAPMFYPFEDNTTFSAGKAYLQIPTAWLPANAQKSLSIRFDDGATTEIDEVKGEDGNVKTVYDLQGRVVKNPTNGIYIIDGKKVFVK